MQAERIAIKRIVFIFEEGLRPAIAALRDMVGMPRKYRPCQPSYRV